MKRYLVYSEITISVLTEVEAKSKREAKAVALDRDVMHLCHNCASGDERGVDTGIRHEWVTSGELDGTPTRITECAEIDDA